MDIDLYITNLAIFEAAGREEAKHALFCQMMYDLSSLDAQDFTDKHLSFAKKAEDHFAELDDYEKAKSIRDAIAYVKNMQETKRRIDAELEKLRKLKEDHGKKDDQ